MSKFTFLTEEQVFGDNKLEIIEKCGVKCAVTDYAILLGCNTYIGVDNDLNGRTGWWWIKTAYNNEQAIGIGANVKKLLRFPWAREGGARPAIPYSVIASKCSNARRNADGILEVEFGEYPQTVVDDIIIWAKETGKRYTVDGFDGSYASTKNINFEPDFYYEYEYDGDKYIRIFHATRNSGEVLSDGTEIKYGKDYWVKIEPITWLVDEKADIALAKEIMFAGVQFSSKPYDGNFEKTDIKYFMDEYFANEIINNDDFDLEDDDEEYIEENTNPYGLKFTEVSEEDIIKGSIESGVAVFLHGPSSEGKSARVKQIDPTCEIIYLRNASPESLNGKSVYNGETGEMIDVKPTWLKKVEAKCESEPDRLHVVFFDEITNALPSIQGIAFNIVLDREVNGIWKLPENARIVASGNEMEDSLAANQLAEPLFNRFAHVYIRTTTESWLRWASENGIHPAIYTFIAYKKGIVLRSEFNGVKPNADPRKWEMASKMLYATGNPEMLRALVGEDITKEFIAFCKTKIITIEDVIADNYNEEEIKNLNTAERYATAMTLSQVDENNLEKVRNFATKLGGEYRAIFDSLWTHGDDERLERLAEAKLLKLTFGGKRR